MARWASVVGRQRSQGGGSTSASCGLGPGRSSVPRKALGISRNSYQRCMVSAMRLSLRRSRESHLPATREEGLGAALRLPLPLTLPQGFDPELAGLFGFGSSLVERIGSVDRCLQLNSQQVASMPLRYKCTPSASPFQPRWVTDPDPAWYPNGIHDAVFSAVWSIYARGEAVLWVTSRYETGYPATFTVLDPRAVDVEQEGGQRQFASNGVDLNPNDVIQVQRNPNGALRGTGALEAYSASVASAYMAEAYAADVFQSTGATRVALRVTSPHARPSQEQAQELQSDWVNAVRRRGGAPAVLPADIELLQAL